ncbi:DUF6768 family protein [uncultured Litoreibacter sp.]|uniref:DUF6768 family protein n=1 Tax=uncultured Litoreibacter sp. TaxID=1392394 RepID=UPI00262F7C77|nr:DUF6768 family protein [uncultured Litoreibacter sp.]
MTNSEKTRLDDLIKAALTGQDKDILKETEELGYLALGLSQFGGKLGWVTWVIMVVQAVLFIVGVCCAVQLFAAVDVLAAVKWGISSAVLMIMAVQLKLSLAPQMQADRVIREVKRLELLVVNASDT